MVPRSKVSAVLVTRGDVDMTLVVESLPFDDIVIWDNSQRQDLKCYGRFAGIAEAKHDHIYVQDDDVLVDALALLEHYDGTSIVANVPPDEEWNWIGWGAFFPREFAIDTTDTIEDFNRVADIVFAYSRPYKRVWVGAEPLPWAEADNRMYKQPDHYIVRERAREETRKWLT